jgi:anti-anti-sigma factor
MEVAKVVVPSAVPVPGDDDGGHPDRTAVLMVGGEIDVATGTKLRSELAASLADPDVDRVIADLTSVTFMSSTGIAVLVDAHAEADQVGKPLSLITGHNRAVLNPLRVSGVDRLLNLVPAD